jgi:hypothetical protein
LPPDVHDLLAVFLDLGGTDAVEVEELTGCLFCDEFN